MESFHGTTILSVRRNGVVALGGDGQVTLGNVVIKATARKIRRLYHDRVLAGFAGASTASVTILYPRRMCSPGGKPLTFFLSACSGSPCRCHIW